MVVTDMTKHGAIDEAEICECQLIEQTVQLDQTGLGQVQFDLI